MNIATKSRVFVVEDDDENAEKYVDWLRTDGYEVERAADAEEARHNITEFQPDVVVLDLQIPSANKALDEDIEHGMGVLKHFVEAEPFRPVVITTAHGRNPEIVRRVLQITRGGAFLHKDESVKTALLKVVATALQSPAYVASKKVKAFEDIVANPPRDTNTWENDIRKELHKNWRVLVGPQYKDCHSPYPIHQDMNADLLFVRPDGYADIWELKLPNDPIFEKYNHRKRLSKESSTGIGQLIEYIDRAEKTPLDFQDYAIRRAGGTFVHRPRGILVIGRDHDDVERDRLALENSFYAGIRIMTYDDLLRGARDLLKYLREHRNGFDTP